MATVQRNVKTYGNRNFVGEVASAPSNYAPILSNEVDADFDTIYAAWNGGADTVNVKDGSVTFAKLAPDAQLWRDTGTSLTPGTNFATRPVVAVPGDGNAGTVLLGSATAKGRVTGLTSTPGTIGMFANRNWVTNAQDDATKPSWSLALNAVTDNVAVQRSPAGSTTQANLLILDNAGTLGIPGNFNAAGFSVGRIYAGAIRATVAQGGYTGYGQVALPLIMQDSGGIATNPGSWELVMPPYASWCYLHTQGTVDANAGSGIVLAIECFLASTWTTMAQYYLVSIQNVWSWGALIPITTGSARTRLTINNFTGAGRTVNNAILGAVSFGKV
jgi:hypothetical protein